MTDDWTRSVGGGGGGGEKQRRQQRQLPPCQGAGFSDNEPR